jgi:hypothetical protein
LINRKNTQAFIIMVCSLSALLVPLLIFANYAAAQEDHLISLKGGVTVQKDDKELASYVAQGFTTALKDTCTIKLYDTPAKKALGQKDLKLIQKVFIKKFNLQYGSVASGPQVLAYDTEATDQVVGEGQATAARRRRRRRRNLLIVKWTWTKITIGGAYVCRLCTADNSDRAPANLASKKKKLNKKGIAEKILKGLGSRDFFAPVSCLKISCSGTLVDESLGCDAYASDEV